MKIMLKIWVILGFVGSVIIAETKYDSEYLTQDSNYQPDESSYHHSSDNRHQQLRTRDSAHRDYLPASDPRHYQSLDSRYHRSEPEHYSSQPQYHGVPQQIQYHQPEDPSYHKPQEIAYQQSPQEYHTAVPQYQSSYERSHSEDKEESPKYAHEEPKYSQAPASSHSSHPAPVPVDPKLPLYFTMYEKRVVQDPMNKYGKGPWRYLTYGHGLTYGSKEPGKVFEKGYGYIRALGRDHCNLPEHLCPPRDEKPFEYEGRKEPYFGYRPH